ncbi:MAG TPA: nucleotidyl transferase AbiEii/AbiGii toxin family protein [Candidatus Paceibacterota bacterium]
MEPTTKNSIIWHTEILPKSTHKALDFLSTQKWLEESDWYLAGGTALALQVGHRSSVDLDFFIPTLDFSTDILITHFKDVEWELDFTREATVYGKLLGAKVSFIGYPFFLPKEKFLPYGSVKVLQTKDVAVMKIIALSQRGKKRDFVDLYWYVRNIESLEQVILKINDQYPQTNHNLHHILKSLTYFPDADEDPMPNINFSVTWQEVKDYFLKEVPILTRKLLDL